MDESTDACNMADGASEPGDIASSETLAAVTPVGTSNVGSRERTAETSTVSFVEATSGTSAKITAKAPAGISVEPLTVTSAEVPGTSQDMMVRINN